jgi:hypothetical protein
MVVEAISRFGLLPGVRLPRGLVVGIAARSTVEQEVAVGVDPDLAQRPWTVSIDPCW